MASQGDGKAIAKELAEGWQTVNRRRKKDGLSANPRVQTYIPYKTRPLYSKIHLTSFTSKPPAPTLNLQPSIAATNPTNHNTTTMSASPPHSPPSSPKYNFSPHSPTKLRFPPSPVFSEWRGRCFRCCRTGHSTSLCRNPKHCGKCWGEGHVGAHCKGSSLNPAAMPYWSSTSNLSQSSRAPSDTNKFQDLLRNTTHASGLTMPENRPKRLTYFAECDQVTLAEIAKLENGVVFNTHGNELGFSVEDIAGFATKTKLVDKSEIAVSALSKERFLILLPQGLAVDRFIRATTHELWDGGFSFQPWSQEDQAKLVVPEYKVLVDLEGLPPHLYRTREVARAIGTFGTYLGSVPQSNLANLAHWTVAVAVDKLERVPEELAVNVRGFEHVAAVHPHKWIRANLYSAAELSRNLPRYTKQSINPPSTRPVSPDSE